MTCGVYIITNIKNGRRYIGYSQYIEKRYRWDIEQLETGAWKACPDILNDFKSLGEEGFVCGILEVTTNDETFMNTRSEYWKKLIKPEYRNQRVTSENV